MNRVTRRGLSLEPLENRICPALTIRLIAGSLFVSGVPASTLTIEETAANTFQVRDGATVLGTFPVGKNISVRLPTRPTDVDIDLNTFTLGGNLLINLGNGDTVGAASAVFVHGGRVGGSVTLQRGNGNETFNIGQAPGAVTDAIQIGGNVTATAIRSRGIGLAAPRDTLFLFPGSRVGGDLSTSFVDGVLVTATSTVSRNMTVNNSQEAPRPSVSVVGTVSQNVSVIGPNSGQTFSVGATGVVGQNLSVTVLGGTSTTTLSAGSVIRGSASITTGSGGDTVTASGLVSGSLLLSLGESADTATLSAGAIVDGDMLINAGNGGSTLTIDGAVSGDLSFVLGNGTNGVTITDAPSGQLNWLSGNGTNTLTLGGAASDFWNVNLRFGTGDDTLTLGGAAAQSLIGRVDFGGDLTGDTFTQGANWTLEPNVTLINLP